MSIQTEEVKIAMVLFVRKKEHKLIKRQSN